MSMKRVISKDKKTRTARSTKTLLTSNRKKLNADADVEESPISVIERTVSALGADPEKIKCDETAIYLLLDDNKQAIITPDTEESGTYEVQTKEEDKITTDSAGNYTNLDELRETVGIEVKVDEPVDTKQENKKVLRAGENYKASLLKKKDEPETEETVDEEEWEEVDASASRKTAKLNASYDDLDDEELQGFVDELETIQGEFATMTVDNDYDIESFIDDVYMRANECTAGELIDEMESIIQDYAERMRFDPESAEDEAEGMLSDLDDAIQDVLDGCYSELEARGVSSDGWEDLESSRVVAPARGRKPMNASRRHKPMSKLQPQPITKTNASRSRKLNANTAKAPQSLRAGVTCENCTDSNAIAKAILDATGTAQAVQGCLFNMPDSLTGNPTLYLIYEDTEEKLIVVTPVDTNTSGAVFSSLDEAIAKIKSSVAEEVTDVVPMALPGDIIDVVDFKEVIE